MKKIVSIILTLLILGSCSTDNEVDELIMKSEAKKGVQQDKVNICHKGKTLSIDVLSVQDHLDHGDKVGPCGDVDYTYVPDDNFEQALIDFYKYLRP